MEPKWREVRCQQCNKLLFKVDGMATVEIVCPRCSCKTVWPDLSKAILFASPRKVLPLPRVSTAGA